VNAGPGEENLANAIHSATNGAAQSVMCTISQLIALTRRVALVIAGDTGPLHLACALEKLVVGIYGATDPTERATKSCAVHRASATIDGSRRPRLAC
jgi:heptosyltransferase-1